MRQYETIFVADPDVPDEGVTAMTTAFAAAVAEHQGEVLKTEDWGRRRLAYEVRKRREGHYVLVEYACGDARLPHELERRLRMNEQIIKFLTVRIDNDPKRIEWEARRAEREKEQAARRAAGAALDEGGPVRPEVDEDAGGDWA